MTTEIELIVGEDTYADLDFFVEYALYRGKESWLEELSDYELETRLFTALIHLDNNYTFIGQKLDPEQELQWPRLYAGVYSETIPKILKQAQCELAINIDSIPESITGNISSISAGSVSIDYINSKIKDRPDLPFVKNLLRPLLDTTTANMARIIKG